jgi:putative peptidoglycan lipid II flippase
VEPLTDNCEVGSAGAHGEEPLPEASGSIGLAAAIIFIGSVVGRLFGLLREQLAANKFGAGDQIAALTVADNLNSLIFDLIANGMLQAALIPVLATVALGSGTERFEFRRLTGAMLTLSVIVSAFVAITGIALAPQLVRMMTALGNIDGSRAQSATDLATENLRLVLPSLVFLASGVVLMAALYSRERPAGPSIGTASRNLAAVVAMLLLADRYGVKSMAFGVVAGSVVMVVIQLIGLWRIGQLPILNFGLRQPALEQILGLYGPVLVGLLVSTAVVILDRNLAWRAEPDAVGAMRYATALVQLILGLVVAAVSLAVLPQLSFRHAAGNESGFVESLGRALNLVTVLIIPAVFGMAALARPIVQLLFEHGATDRDAANLITKALLLYLPGHLLAGYDQVLIFAFYSRRNTITPVLVGMAASAAYVAGALLLFNRYEMAGLVAANSIQFAVHTGLMLIVVGRSIRAHLVDAVAPVISRVVAASGLMALTVVASWKGLDQFIDDERFVSELSLVLCPAFIGGFVYLCLARLLGVAELTAGLEQVRDRLRPLLSRP